MTAPRAPLGTVAIDLAAQATIALKNGAKGTADATVAIAQVYALVAIADAIAATAGTAAACDHADGWIEVPAIYGPAHRGVRSVCASCGEEQE